MTRGIELRRHPTGEMIYSIDCIRARTHEALLEMERALPYGCVILYAGWTVRADPVDYGEDGLGNHIVMPGLKYYRLNVRILLPETNA